MPKYRLLVNRNVSEEAIFEAPSFKEAQEMVANESVWEQGLEFDEVYSELLDCEVEEINEQG